MNNKIMATWPNKHPFVLRHPADDGGPTGYQGVGAGVSGQSYNMIPEVIALRVTRIIPSLPLIIKILGFNLICIRLVGSNDSVGSPSLRDGVDALVAAPSFFKK